MVHSERIKSLELLAAAVRRDMATITERLHALEEHQKLQLRQISSLADRISELEQIPDSPSSPAKAWMFVLKHTSAKATAAALHDLLAQKHALESEYASILRTLEVLREQLAVLTQRDEEYRGLLNTLKRQEAAYVMDRQDEDSTEPYVSAASSSPTYRYV